MMCMGKMLKLDIAEKRRRECSDRMKIIGLMCTWNNLEFLKCSLPQALSFCDELILVEGCHSGSYPKRSTDGTCEYIETMRESPKLVVRDFDFNGRYDKVQRQIRNRFPKDSTLYKPGNWVFNWDDDVFLMDEDLPKLRAALESTSCNQVRGLIRHFLFNFRFNAIMNGWSVLYRITDGLYLSGVSNANYKGDRNTSREFINGITWFHYNYVKKPERFKARMAMSVEKGTATSKGQFERFMSVRWDKDEDILNGNAFAEIKRIRPEGELNIYIGEHPEAVASHPWRHINDVREAK